MGLTKSNPLSWKPVHRLLKTCLDTTERSFGWIAQTSTTISSVTHIARNEHKYWREYPLPLSECARAWRHGFTSRDYVLLDLAENNPDEYLSSVQQRKLVYPAINEEYRDVLRNKVVFYLATRAYVDAVPTVYGTIHQGSFEPLEGAPVSDDLTALISDEGEVIIKPTTGTMGRNIHHIKAERDVEFSVNGERLSESELRETIDELDGYLVCEFVQQHDYAAAICPYSANTIRVLTMKDPDAGEMFIASAVHRFGNASTGPVDNWSGGGFAAPVHTDTGELGRLFTYSTSRGLERLDCHPDTGTKVSGQVVPEWDTITETVLEIAALHKEIPYVGWDVVLSKDGPTILEGNAAPHLGLQQLGHGLFVDPRVERFFTEYVQEA